MRKLSYEDAVVKFKLRAKVCKTIKTQFKSDEEFSEDLFSCWDCSHPILDTSSHIRQCHHYADLRESLDLDKTEDTVTFFKRVIKRRERKEEEDDH